VTIASMTVENNLRDGIAIDVSDVNSNVAIERVVVQGNGEDGIHVRAAPGSSNLDDVLARLEPSTYGVTLRSVPGDATPSAEIRNNGAHGIHLGDPAQSADVSALIEGVSISGNLGSGLAVEQKTGNVPGADCGVSAGQPGCTGATIAGNTIHDNAGPGVQLGTSFIIPLSEPVDHGLGFVRNSVYHNAMADATCTSVQTMPQVLISGPVGLGNASCGEATTQASCEEKNSPANQHCYWGGTSCVVTWDLRGATDDCFLALTNRIHSYNTNDAAALSVGMYASGGALVWADGNTWRLPASEQTENVDQGIDSFVDADVTCGGAILTCAAGQAQLQSTARPMGIVPTSPACVARASLR
jgi:hypothetical protein